VVIGSPDDVPVSAVERWVWYLPSGNDEVTGHEGEAGGEMIARLDALAASGGDHVLLPAVARRRLAPDGALQHHLDNNYWTVWSGNDCVIYRSRSRDRASLRPLQVSNVSKADSSSGLLYGCHVDQPKPGDLINGRTLELLGWAIGRDQRIVAVEVLSRDSVIARTPMNHYRPDLIAAFPEMMIAGWSGFHLSIPAPDGTAPTELHLQAVLKDRRCAPIGSVLLRPQLEADGMTPDAGLTAPTITEFSEYGDARPEEKPATPPRVSVIIPAYNAASTIVETLACLRAQSMPDWEAIVVDDGSSDDTVALVTECMARDSRIQLVREPHGGVSTARNVGIHRACAPWVLFLDADDLILPHHLERLTGVIAQRPDVDAVYCGWACTALNGDRILEYYPEAAGDLFPKFARYCVFAIHSCLIRHSHVKAVGGFDPSLDLAEDWDLWQRIARMGTDFHTVPEILALYRQQPGSASRNVVPVLESAFRVIEQAYHPDPRVAHPAPAYALGLPSDPSNPSPIYVTCWSAGYLLADGEDAWPLLDLLLEPRVPDLDPERVVSSLLDGMYHVIGQSIAALHDVWNRSGPGISTFLDALEGVSGSPKLARRVSALLEQRILERSAVPRPVVVGRTVGVTIEATEYISDLYAATPVERAQITLTCEGTILGTLELPVCGQLIPKWVLHDAIAAQFGRDLLHRFLAYTVYPDLDIAQGSGRTALRRAGNTLVEATAEEASELLIKPADRLDQLLLLQELWGRPEWTHRQFFSPDVANTAPPASAVKHGPVPLEIGVDTPAMTTPLPELTVVPTVRGRALGVVTITATDGVLPAHRVRAAVITACGIGELGRTCAREALLERPLFAPSTLQTRLTPLRPPARTDLPDLPAWTSGSLSYDSSDESLERWPSPWGTVVLGRRRPEPRATSIQRRAVLPASCLPDLIAAASTAAEPMVGRITDRPSLDRHVVYDPELIRLEARVATSAPPHLGEDHDGQITTRVNHHRRHEFETIFADGPDPWDYTTPYEQTKYEQTLSLVPPGPIDRALELACAEGHFTVQLAPHVQRLVAADISQIALGRAAERCGHQTNIDYQRLDLVTDPLPGRFDLIVCSEVLYVLRGLEELQDVSAKLAAALRPGGSLVVAHPHLVVDEPNQPGFDWPHPFGAKVIGEVLAAEPSLCLVEEIRTPLYRVQRFLQSSADCGEVHVARSGSLAEQVAGLNAAAAAGVLPSGGPVATWLPTPMIGQLPILMYHRVAPTGSAPLARYRVAPSAFEQQLDYLRDSGYKSLCLETWHTARITGSPLPDRPVLITFDDGYVDFQEYAWPLLRRYGFDASLFVVPDHIGGSNEWDRAYGETVPLLQWADLRRLQAEGVRIGAHSASHAPLTGLSPAEVVREGARSRATLQHKLGSTVRVFAYPYGDVNRSVQHLIGACGYEFGLSSRPGHANDHSPLLDLPRIEIRGDDDLATFVAKLDS